jgi:hypothetical protein
MLGVDGLALNSATHFACDVENALTSESLESVLAEAFWVRTHAPERNDDSANEGRVLPGDLEHPGVANAEREARAAIEGPWVLAELAGTYVTHYGSLRSAAQAHARTGALGPVELVPAASLELFACPPIQAIEVGRLTPELERTLEALAALVPEEGEFDLSELLAAAREL